jgi:hypothetical protein
VIQRRIMGMKFLLDKLFNYVSHLDKFRLAIVLALYVTSNIATGGCCAIEFQIIPKLIAGRLLAELG